MWQDESSHFDVDDSQNSAYLGFSGRLGAGKSGRRVEGSLVRGEGNGRASRKEKDGSGELHGVVVNLSVLFVIMNSMRGEQNGARRERKAQTSEPLKRASIERRRGPRTVVIRVSENVGVWESLKDRKDRERPHTSSSFPESWRELIVRDCDLEPREQIALCKEKYVTKETHILYDVPLMLSPFT